MILAFRLFSCEVWIRFNWNWWNNYTDYPMAVTLKSLPSLSFYWGRAVDMRYKKKRKKIWKFTFQISLCGKDCVCKYWNLMERSADIWNWSMHLLPLQKHTSCMWGLCLWVTGVTAAESPQCSLTQKCWFWQFGQRKDSRLDSGRPCGTRSSMFWVKWQG